MSTRLHYFVLFLFFIILLPYNLYGQKESLNIADSLLKQRSFSEAINKYQSIIRQSPNNESVIFGLQSAYLQSGQLLSALSINNIFLSDRLLWGKIRTLFYSNLFDSIPLYIVELIRRFPNSDFVNDALDLGLLLTECSDDTSNLKVYAQAHYQLEIQDYLNSINEVQKIISKSGHIVEYGYLLLSRIFVAQKQFNQAIATLNEFSAKFPSSKFVAKARYELGMIYLESIKDTIMAKNIFEDIISDYPASPECFFARSQLVILNNIKTKEMPK